MLLSVPYVFPSNLLWVSHHFLGLCFNLSAVLCVCVCVCVLVAQLCLTLCDLMDVAYHRILQARILEWVAILFSRGSDQPKDWTCVSHVTGRLFTVWATREAWICQFYFNSYIEHNHKNTNQFLKLRQPDTKRHLFIPLWVYLLTPVQIYYETHEIKPWGVVAPLLAWAPSKALSVSLGCILFLQVDPPK